MGIFRYKYFFAFLLMGISIPAFPQQKKVDSLLRIVSTVKADTLKLNAYLEISGIIIYSNPDSAFMFANEALKIANRIDHVPGRIQAENMRGNYYQRKGEYEKSLKAYLKCLKLSEEINDLKGLAQAKNNIGIIYTDQGEYDKALNAYQESLRYERKRKNRNGEAEALNNIGVIHYYLGNMDQTIKYLSEAVEIEEELGNKQVLKKSYNNLGAIMDYVKDYDGALKYYEKAFDLSKSLNDKKEMSLCINNIAGIYQNTGKIEKAEQYYQQSLILKKELGDKNGEALIYINLGTVETKRGNIEKSISYYKKALAISEKLNLKMISREAYKNLASAYEGKNDFRNALLYQKKMGEIKDSLLNEEKTKAVAEMEAKYQSAEKERLLLAEKTKTAELEKINAIKERNVALEKEKTAKAQEAWAKTKNLSFVLAGGIISLFFLGLFVIQRNRRKAQAEKDAVIILEREKGLKAVIESTETERRRIARDLHDGVGQQLGGLKLAWQQLGKGLPENEKKKIENLSGILNETAGEIRQISHQMMPRMLEEDGLVVAMEDMLKKSFFQSDVEVEFNHAGIEKRFNKSIELALFRVVQELTSNVIKHAGASKVTVDVILRKQKLVLMFEDNGKGISLEMASSGIGMQNMKGRISVVGGEMQIQSSAGKGTSVIVSVPVE